MPNVKDIYRTLCTLPANSRCSLWGAQATPPPFQHTFQGNRIELGWLIVSRKLRDIRAHVTSHVRLSACEPSYMPSHLTSIWQHHLDLIQVVLAVHSLWGVTCLCWPLLIVKKPLQFVLTYPSGNPRLKHQSQHSTLASQKPGAGAVVVWLRYDFV